MSVDEHRLYHVLKAWECSTGEWGIADRERLSRFSGGEREICIDL